jgi:hypothetical protein
MRRALARLLFRLAKRLDPQLTAQPNIQMLKATSLRARWTR